MVQGNENLRTRFYIGNFFWWKLKKKKKKTYQDFCKWKLSFRRWAEILADICSWHSVENIATSNQQQMVKAYS
jgi:hypothetical protein